MTINIPKIKLNDQTKIDQIGLGLYLIKDKDEFRKAFRVAYQAGYRMFDSAQFYQNEQFIAQNIQELKIKREDIYITSKIAVNNFGYKKTKKSFEESLKKLNTNYLDLILLHFPVTLLRKKSWKALEELKIAGKAKSIGVSNYTIRHLEEMKKYAQIMPSINQVELHVFLQQPELLSYCQENNIQLEAYAPLAHGLPMDNPQILEVANKHHKSYAQIMLRFLIELNLIVIPKSINPDRIKENIAIFDFKLDKEDILKLKSLNRNLRTCWDPTRIP